jgi:hypothetical protein
MGDVLRERSELEEEPEAVEGFGSLQLDILLVG